MKPSPIRLAFLVLGLLPAITGARHAPDGDFDREFARLRQGPSYTAQRAGTFRLINKTGSIEHHYAVTVPDGYDPARRYPARIQLHGGVMMRQSNVPPSSAGGIGTLAGDEPCFYIVPFAWDASPWWRDDQLRNLRAILDAVRRTYNIDENRVFLSGVSDGGTGALYVAMRDTTAYAAFLPLNGFWGVLANRDLQVDGPLYPGNLRNKPLFIVNGERDPLYPTAIVDGAVAHYRRIGVALDYLPQAGAGHNTRWWPSVKDRFEQFTRDHPRNPLPDVLTWETADATAFNRAHWLVIDALGSTRGDAALDDPNLVTPPSRPDFGARSVGNRINRVVAGSNAEKIGLRAGDGLVRVNDQPARIRIGVEELFEGMQPGSPLTLLVARDNAPIELTGVYEPATITDPAAPLFDRDRPSGRVDLTRSGNRIDAKTRGVRAFTLLLSPDRFDFSREITVVVNGRVRHRAKVAKSLDTLQKWAAVDNDRTMLFAAELRITVE
jgi:hypothetical protein